MATYDREAVLAAITEYHRADRLCLQSLFNQDSDYRSLAIERRQARTKARALIEAAPDSEQDDLQRRLSVMGKQAVQQAETEAAVTPAASPTKPARHKRLLDALVSRNKPLARQIFEQVKKRSAGKPLDRNKAFKTKLEQQLSLRLARVGIIQADTVEAGAENRKYWFDKTAVNQTALTELYQDEGESTTS